MSRPAPRSKRNEECVKVIVRCRPLSRKEVDQGCQRIVAMDTALGQVSLKNPKADKTEPPKQFTFDRIYDWNSRQDVLFDETARPIVESVMAGYNGTIFAYGQTGTGKTHTMEGKDEKPELRGIIPNSFKFIFESIGTSSSAEHLVRASFLEIYNEEIRDLLAKDPKQKLDLKETVDQGVYVKDLTSFVVKGVDEIDHVMQVGKKNRTVGCTLMNQDSSRSHSIFTIVIETSELGADGQTHIRAGKLNLVDLAGSERQSKTGATGDRLKEATKINLSLSALGNCISALVDGKSSHIPYRDSKLTRLLQDSLGGNTKTVMIATIGPADYNYDETVSTCRYANRAKNIKNRPKINEDPKDAMLREFQEEIARLKAKLEEKEAMGGGAVGGGPQMDQFLQSHPDIDPAMVERMMAGEPIVETKVVEVEKIVKVGLTDEEIAEKELEMQARLDAEKHALMAEKDIMEEEKQVITEEMLKYREAVERERKEKEETEIALRQLEEKLLVGGKDVYQKAEEQEKELERTRLELEERQRQEQQLARELEEREELRLCAEEQYATLQEEVDGKTKKLKKVIGKYKAAQTEIHDLQEEFQREREDLLDSIRELTRQLKLKNTIIEHFIPPEEVNKIERRAEWDDENDEWRVSRIAYAGNMRAKRPVSAAGLKRPTSDFARIATAMGDNNPRYKYDNIIGLELDMPDRTTQDYEGPVQAPRVQAALNAALAEEEDMTLNAAENLPNVYYSYSEAGEEIMNEQRAKRAARPKSSRRPGTARKKKDPSNGRSVGASDDLTNMIMSQGEPERVEEELYPTKKGTSRYS